MDPLKPEVPRSCFGEYLPLAKSCRTQGGDYELFKEVVKFILEAAFVGSQFHYMPKQRAGFIIATFEGETID